MLARIINEKGDIIRSLGNCEFNIDGNLAVIRGRGGDETKVQTYYVDLTKFLLNVEEANFECLDVPIREDGL